MIFKRGSKVKLIKDLKHYRSIFNHAESLQPKVTTVLKAGKILIVSNHFDDGIVECELNGYYYNIPEESLINA